MSRVTVDAATMAKFQNIAEPLEICDASGKTLGYFCPVTAPAKQPIPQTPFTREELEERRKETVGGRPLAEVLAELNQL